MRFRLVRHARWLLGLRFWAGNYVRPLQLQSKAVDQNEVKNLSKVGPGVKWAELI
jgi:hypothetical protein